MKVKKPKAKTVKSVIESVTLKQEIFCQEWVDSIGNGTIAALKAFDIKDKDLFDKELPEKPKSRGEIIKWNRTLEDIKRRKKIAMNTAANVAKEYLRKPYVAKRIDEILEERAFNDNAVKREHFKLIADSKDEVKIRAIDTYYKLKGKFIDNINLSGNIEVTNQPYGKALDYIRGGKASGKNCLSK